MWKQGRDCVGESEQDSDIESSETDSTHKSKQLFLSDFELILSYRSSVVSVMMMAIQC